MRETLDVIGVGIGPFNLGLAALMEEKTTLKSAFFDETNVFQWHPGMLLDGTDLQVPFLADLVSFANPMSQYSFLNYAHVHDRLMSFFFFNRFDVPRKEYNAYCHWVVTQLNNCHFGKKVVDVQYVKSDACYQVTVEDRDKTEHFYCKHLVVGTGSEPIVPADIEGGLNEDIIHSSSYGFYEKEIKKAQSVTVIGSGQSAAEIFYKLLDDQLEEEYELSWFTRSPGFFQLEDSKLGQELFSPTYIDYFHNLTYEQREEALPLLGNLRNGVQQKTLHKIYDKLYHRSIETNQSPALIQAAIEINQVETSKSGDYLLSGKQWQEDQSFTHRSEKIIFATGYKPHIPDWLTAMMKDVEMESESEFAVTRNAELIFKDQRKNRVFTLTNLEHALGTSATNLGLSVERNVRIINELANQKVYKESPGPVFQQFSNKA
ncbi:SidA/IucD/PvdA family monooxygenase [Shouchella sp. 1P09AA]|uniref:lysine N(6)-hydroxylase/L-ornithine N(5)-oxygenase family protein n=1 Tax=unclassified Shouchella TaxID=2893065 RepID=UPI0039A1C0F8